MLNGVRTYMSHLQASFGMELLLWVASVASRPENAKRILVGHGSISTAAGGAGNVNNKGNGKDDDDDEAFMFGLAKYMLVTRSMANVRPTTLIIQIQAALDNAAISGVDECWCARACACVFYSYGQSKKKKKNTASNPLYLPPSSSSSSSLSSKGWFIANNGSYSITGGLLDQPTGPYEGNGVGCGEPVELVKQISSASVTFFCCFFERRKRRREKKIH